MISIFKLINSEIISYISNIQLSNILLFKKLLGLIFKVLFRLVDFNKFDYFLR